MTLYELVDFIQKVAKRQPNVRSVGNGDIYDYLNTKGDIVYDVFWIAQTTHRLYDEFDHYGFVLYYVDRLNSDMEENRLQSQSIGKEVITNVVETVCEYLDIEMPEITFTPFTQEFKDECVGMYANVIFDIPVDFICPEYY